MPHTPDPITRDPIARLDGVVKRYGRLTALDGADLRLQRGELLALLGPNGAGKTTAIGLLLGLIRSGPMPARSNCSDRIRSGSRRAGGSA